jgi:hypothetical protein
MQLHSEIHNLNVNFNRAVLNVQTLWTPITKQIRANQPDNNK